MIMKKLDSKGFVLAETLVVAVFLMAIFTLIFTNFYPLIGEYEKRETYDNVDGKYAVYWLKRMIEDSSYVITPGSELDTFFKQNGYVRFECKNIVNDPEKTDTCKRLVKALEIKGCDGEGNNCEAYITKYQLLKDDDTSIKWFKNNVKTNNKQRYQVNCTSSCNKNQYIQKCKENHKNLSEEQRSKTCTDLATRKEFRNGFKDYVESLPDYKVESLDNAGYRVIAAFQHKKDNNSYYSYATIEVSR